MDTPESASVKMETFRINEEKRLDAKRAELLKQAEKKDKESAKDKQKQDLKDQAMALGLKTSGSRNELRKRIAKEAKEDKKKKDILDDLKLQQARKSLSGSGNDKEYERQEEKLNEDVDKWKLAMRSGNASWADAWGSIQRTYGLSVERIDELLGLDYRAEHDK